MDITERLFNRRWGVFTHFLYGEPGSQIPTEQVRRDWNLAVNNFDTEKLARQLNDVGAGYYFITIMQGQKYMIAPNETFNRICGTQPGEACATRDLVLDLYQSLSKYDIDLCLYYTGDGPWKDKVCGPKFGLSDPRGSVTAAFVEKWSSVLAEYAQRYGDKIKAWWIDGCYDWLGYNNDNIKLYYDAIKKANPEAIVTFNNGVQESCYKWFCDEDYTAGEFNDLNVITTQAFYGGSRAHILAPLGAKLWRSRGVTHDNAYLKEYVKNVNCAGGFVTIDIYIDHSGNLDEEQLNTIRGL